MKHLFLIILVLMLMPNPTHLAESQPTVPNTKQHDDNAHWSYQGETGPGHWKNLSPEFSTCGGFNQSPINISNAINALLKDIHFDYKATSFSMLNNGHAIQINYDPGSSITIGHDTFELFQFHFHSPSENHIDGMSYPMEVHLVHKSKDDELAVIGVMFKEGQENAMIKGLWHYLSELTIGTPLKKNDIQVNAYALLPSNKEYYRFNGSLTTPPCSEGVRWMVMKNPLEVSSAQIKQLVNLIGPNNRPIQPINARPILK